MVSVPGAQGTNEGGALVGAACTTECRLPAKLEHTRGGTVWTKALVFPPTRGSCTAAAAPLVLGGGGGRTRSSSK